MEQEEASIYEMRRILDAAVDYQPCPARNHQECQRGMSSAANDPTYKLTPSVPDRLKKSLSGSKQVQKPALFLALLAYFVRFFCILAEVDKSLGTRVITDF